MAWSIKTYKYRIYGNKTTTEKLYGVLNLCRELYKVCKKTLDERLHSCECGAEMDRDTASSKVILDLGDQALSVGTRPTGQPVEASPF
jgi:hypothetical protein